MGSDIILNDVIFSETKKLAIKSSLGNFINGNPIDTTVVRKEILESWHRSKNHGVNPYFINKEAISISKKELEDRIKARKLFYKTAIPIMENLYNFVANSGFMIILSDEEGYVLKIIGDTDIVEFAKKNLLIEGCNRNEKVLGTNAIGTCNAIKKPIQIWASEHYYLSHLNWTCSGAPVFDSNGTLLGSLCITGTWDKVHMHTLGMAVSSAEAISKQIKMQTTFDEMFELKSQLDTIIETLNYGVILLNNNYVITQVNSHTSSFLDMKKEDIIGIKIDKYIKDINFSKIKNNIYDKEIQIKTKKGTIRCSLCAIMIDNNMAHVNQGLVITFKEIKYVHKMINKMIGSNAHFHFNDIIGESDAIKEAKKLAEIASQNNANVLLIGDSGSGKELFAQAIHNDSQYSNGPFIAINCGALPRSLIESELFGYESGTFTGAKKEGHAGKFELANGGTIFLDEIGDMPFDVQVNILRVIQTKEVTRIGGKKPIKIDVRIIAATNKNLEDAIANNTFRLDLYYRLNVFNIKIPPLCERGYDICLLANYFLKKYKMNSSKIITDIDKDVYDVLMNYSWPGNIRELENTIERAVLVTQDKNIKVSDLPSNITSNSKINKSITPSYIHEYISPKNITIDEMEKNTIKDTLLLYEGNIKKTAENLGISRRTLYRKLEKYTIDYNQIRKSGIR